MGDHSIIADVNDVLVRLLTTGMQSAFPTDPPDISLKSPSEVATDGDTGKRQVSLFLFRVVEDADLGNRAAAEADPTSERRLPLQLRLHYLVTPYSKDRADEHRIFGRALQVLHDHDSLDESDTTAERGNFAGSDDELRLVFRPLDIEAATQVWNALSIPYRLSACYEVGPVAIDSQRAREVRRVVEGRMRHGVPVREGVGSA